MRLRECWRKSNYFSLNNHCIECPDTDYGAMISVGILLVILFVALFYVASEMLSDVAGVVTMAITHFQVIEISVNLKVPVPGVFRLITDWVGSIVSGLFFDLFFSPECAVSMDFYEKWSLMTFTPLIILFATLLFGFFLEDFLLFYMMMVVFYVFGLSQTWKMWDCVKLDDGSYGLESDPSIVCFNAYEDNQWGGFAFLAILLLIMYTSFPFFLSLSPTYTHIPPNVIS